LELLFFDEGCSQLLDQRKQAELQWLQDPSNIKGNNLNNVKHKPADISGIKRRNIWKTKRMSLQ
jgi:hypothetical protein